MILVDTNPYKSVVVLNENEDRVTLSEGDHIQFTLESGEVRQGTLTKMLGKDEKLKIQMLSSEKNCEEIWPTLIMVDGSLKLAEEVED